MSKSDFLEDAVLNHVLRGVAFPSLAGSVYVALHTADPADTGAGAEASGGSYARVAVTRGTGAWSAPSNASGAQRVTNSAAITFPAPTGNWGTITHVGIWDAATTGNLLYRGALTSSRVVNNGDQAPSFAIGALTVSES